MSDKLLSWEDAVSWLRQQPGRQDLVRDCYYDDPIEEAAERFRFSDEWCTVSSLLKSLFPGRVLDIGAGRGMSSYAFAKAGCQVTAVEPDPSPLVGAEAIRRLCASTSTSIDIVQATGERLPFRDRTFDIVYGRAVMHHARDLNLLCSEAARVLKPGGLALFTREHVISRRGDVAAFLHQHALHRLYGGENAFLLREYRDAFREAGFLLKWTLGPFTSAVNYAPVTMKSHEANTIQSLSRLVGTKAAGSKLLQAVFLHVRNSRSNQPGRLYSFFGQKRQ